MSLYTAGMLGNKEGGKQVTGHNALSAGVFWVVAEDNAIDDYTLLLFPIPCDAEGHPTGGHEFDLNAKSGGTYNHEKLWEGEIRGNPAHKPYCKKPHAHVMMTLRSIDENGNWI